jgi:hypothetical protein
MSLYKPNLKEILSLEEFGKYFLYGGQKSPAPYKYGAAPFYKGGDLTFTKGAILKSG